MSTEEETRLLGHFGTLPFAPFDFHGYLGKRRVVSFGWRYDYSSARLAKSDDFPSFLLNLREGAAAAAAVRSDELQQVLVTEYEAGAGIGWHRDKAVFGEVVAVSFVSPCRLRFRRRQGSTWERRAIEVKPRSLYMLRGPARHDWEHSVPPVPSLRYSVTFRSLAAQPQARARPAH